METRPRMTAEEVKAWYAAQHFTRKNNLDHTATLAKMHTEAANAPFIDFEITEEEIAALAEQAKTNPHDAFITCFAIAQYRLIKEKRNTWNCK